MEQKILKTGHSLAVTIPSEFAKILGLRPGRSVKVKSDLNKGIMTLTFPASGQMSLLPPKHS